MSQPQNSADAETVTLVHAYPRPPEAVFDAWLDPALARKFLFATPHGLMVRAETDPRVGGTFRFTDRRGGQDFEHLGRYLTIERPRRLVFAFAVPAFSAEETQVEIDIRPTTGGSELRLSQRGVLADYVERTRAGWTMILDSLGRALDRG